MAGNFSSNNTKKVPKGIVQNEDTVFVVDKFVNSSVSNCKSLTLSVTTGMASYLCGEDSQFDTRDCYVPHIHVYKICTELTDGENDVDASVLSKL